MENSSRCFCLHSVDSTSSEALRLANAGEPAPFWVTAERQLKGRGRRGRNWVSETGNLFASYLIDHHKNPAIGQLPLVAAVALHDALSVIVSEHLSDPISSSSSVDLATLKIKWPNDLMLDGRKVAGVLVESEVVDHHVRLVLGFGVNCAHHPPESNHPATDLATAGIGTTPKTLFEQLATSLQNRLCEWDWGRQFATIRQSWLNRAAGLGRELLVRLPSETFSGRFDGLDSCGHMILATGNGTRLVSAGDVFLLNAEATRDKTNE